MFKLIALRPISAEEKAKIKAFNCDNAAYGTHPIKQKIVSALKDFKIGDIVLRGVAKKLLSTNTVHSIQNNEGLHMQMNKMPRSMSHACKPNLGVRKNDHGSYDWIAVADIKEGEELTWNYGTTEVSVDHGPAVCACGVDGDHTIVGWKKMTEAQREPFKAFHAAHLDKSPI